MCFNYFYLIVEIQLKYSKYKEGNEESTAIKLKNFPNPLKSQETKNS